MYVCVCAHSVCLSTLDMPNLLSSSSTTGMPYRSSLWRIRGMLMALATATATNGTNRPIRGGIRCMGKHCTFTAVLWRANHTYSMSDSAWLAAVNYVQTSNPGMPTVRFQLFFYIHHTGFKQYSTRRYTQSAPMTVLVSKWLGILRHNTLYECPTKKR